MSLSVQECEQHLKDTLGACATDAIVTYVNDVGELLTTAQAWSWLEGRSTTLDLIANQGYAELPTEIREITGYDATDGLLNTLRFTDTGTLLQMRANDIAVTTWNWFGAVTNQPRPTPNLLERSNRVDLDSSWTDLFGSPTFTTGQADPFGGSEAVRMTVVGSGVIRGQYVKWGPVEDGDYTISIYVKKGDLDTPAITVTSADLLTSLAAVTIDFSSDPATASVTGSTTYSPTITPVAEDWYRVECAFTVDSSVIGAGGVSVGLSAGASAGFTDFYGCQLNAGIVARPSYVVSGAVLPEYQEPVPILELWPTPTSTSLGALTIFYRAGWTVVEKDSDLLAIPDWIEPLFKSLLRAYVRGIEEEDEGTVEERVQRVLNGPLMDIAVRRDSRIAPNVGPLRNSAVAMSGTGTPDMLRTTVQGPS